jgi:hypothetical protein
MNNINSVNTMPLSAAAFEQVAVGEMKSLLAEVGWLKGWELSPNRPDNFDFSGRLLLPRGVKAGLYVVCKRDMRPSMFPALADKPEPRVVGENISIRILAAPWISPRVAGLCAEKGWSWFDLAGNHRLDIPGVLHLQQTGNRPVYKRHRPTANLSTPEAARVMRALLAPENAGLRWTQWELQNRCRPEVSIGLVNKLARYLREEAFIAESPRKGFLARDPLKLLGAWSDAYRFDRNRRLGYFTLLQGGKLQNALAAFGGQGENRAVFAAFSAADFQAPHVRQPKTWLYVREQDLGAFEQMVEAKPVDSGENIVLLVPPDEGVFQLLDGGLGNSRLLCTNPVQTYVDLCKCGGRGQEAAAAILEQRLEPTWDRQVQK